jgi:hypothetical protein
VERSRDKTKDVGCARLAVNDRKGIAAMHAPSGRSLLCHARKTLVSKLCAAHHYTVHERCLLIPNALFQTSYPAWHRPLPVAQVTVVKLFCCTVWSAVCTYYAHKLVG